jgi:hypothetical protein
MRYEIDDTARHFIRLPLAPFIDNGAHVIAASASNGSGPSKNIAVGN